MSPTSPTPIISAAAVAEVRLGLRIAFSRAIDPVMPLILRIGAPRAALIGVAMIGPRMATPRKTTAMPTPTNSSPLLPKRPSRSSTTPSMVTTPPTRARRGEVAEESMDESRMAAIGGMREARTAGKTAATTVTRRPVTNDQMTALAGMTMELAGMSRPRTPSNALSPTARKIPPTKPTIDAVMPTRTASNSTDPTTWRCPAPMARSSASSRLRWATMIEKVLKMMKEPTSSATTPKMSRNVLKNDRLSFRLFWLSLVMSFPLITSTLAVSGTPFTAVRMLLTTWSWLTPGSAFTSMESN